MVRQRLARYPPSSTESQWFFTREELDHSPSIQQGMDLKEEHRHRQRMIQLLWNMRSLSRAPQVVLNTAATLLQRFYMRNAVAAALFLAAKVEEKPYNSKNVTSWLRYILQYGSRPEMIRNYKLDESEYALPDFMKRRKDILHVEETMLRMECFDMNLRHPHALLGKVVQKIWNKGKGPQSEQVGMKVMDCAFCVANDTLSSPICLLYQPQVIAACCLLIACVMTRQPLPEKPLSTSEQRTLWDLDREEGEEETAESAFQEELYWLEWLGVRSDDLEEPILFILDNWLLAADPFVGRESEHLRSKMMKALDQIPPWPPVSRILPVFAVEDSTTVKPEEGKGAEPIQNGTKENGVQVEEDVRMGDP
ncbi:uncharacterized protein JCM6883_002857 [Sporobolomyces salmoneus]|uniref:uncharacterized protein n=1 Tax=Sporobolomyces salmoneus TaxID=183962 RepID=UPI00317322D2